MIDLLKRSEAGVAITTAQHDQNFTDIENASNANETALTVIQTTKADLASPVLTGNPTAPTVVDDPYFENVSLLLHFEGPHQSTTIVDSSKNTIACTANGNAIISTGQRKFHQSLAVDGNGDFVSATHADLATGLGDFTLEGWIYRTNQTPNNLFAFWDSRDTINTTIGFIFYIKSDTNKLSFSSGNPAVTTEGTTSLVNATWYHVALVRQGTTIKGYLNGTLEFTTTRTLDFTRTSTRIGFDHIGNVQPPGFIDEVRLTKGVARYTSNFTAPTRRFSSRDIDAVDSSTKLATTRFVSNIIDLYREPLTADRTYYVSTTGNNLNDGLTPGTAFRTIQHAVFFASRRLDWRLFNITIQVSDGTYTESVSVPRRPFSGQLNLLGNTSTPGNVIIDGTTSFCVSVDSTALVRGFKLQNAATFNLNANPYATLSFQDIIFQNTGGGFRYLILGNSHGIAQATGNFTINGSVSCCVYARESGLFRTTVPLTVTLTGSPAFDRFAWSEFQGHQWWGQGGTVTFSGTGTTTNKSYANHLGIVKRGSTVFPGSGSDFTVSGGIVY